METVTIEAPLNSLPKEDNPEETPAVIPTHDFIVPDVNKHKRNDKRPLSTTESCSTSTAPSKLYSSSEDTDKDNDIQNRKNECNKRKKTTKKIRKDATSSDPESDVETMTAPIKEILTQQPNMFILNYINLINFLQEIIGNPNHIDTAKKYTEDIKALSTMLRHIYPSLTHRSIKNRLTRIIKKLENNDNSQDTLDTT
ncbi:hypothetical protein KPH14_001066 [Odynerus spinipes]|uniref:Uncharacterized protein n=1 Tax=Odynerus spinipes TaxID=1348599 RepID=A0AAD9REQ3_9HYME|nr:hypothetical protein KPH14_001066 [Odynerus spinipes]